MERVVDQIILAALCLLLLSSPGLSGAHVVALLAAVTLSCCFDAPSAPPVRLGVAGAYLAAALVLPAFASFLPLAAYVLAFERAWPVRLAWLVPLAAAVRLLEPLPLAALCALCVMACLMALRAQRAADERARYRRLRDDLQERSLSLSRKNHELAASQDYEVRLATLAERARIAREIHDNVGHLLTRSVLQVEALQVVHADDAPIRAELAQVGSTLHEAMDTVRRSVHDLHDDSFDLRSRLEEVIGACGLPNVRLSFDARTVPPPVAQCLMACVREALSNVARHSDATRVDVSVVEYPALYQLIVQDNGTAAGKGMAAGASEDAAAGKAFGARGLGLESMEERVEALGGRLRTEQQAGGGFRVFAAVPKEREGKA